MKRKILITVLTFILLASTLLLFSCGDAAKSIGSYYDIFDKDMPFSTGVSYDTKYTAIPELENYVIDSYTENGETIELANEEFVVFTTMTDSGIISHKVLSMRQQKVIFTFAEKYAIHEIRLVEDAPAFLVKKTVIDPDIDIMLGLDNVVSVTYSLYDAAGNFVVSSDNADKPYVLADMIIYDYAAYTYDHNGIITKKCDVPEYLLLKDCFYWNNTYLYVSNGCDGYSVYDRNFNSVSHWCAPGYTMDGCDTYVLNNLNVLVQYKVILDNDSEKYDYVINDDDYLNLKIDLKTFIVDVKTGEAKELENFNYVIGGVTTKESMLRGSNDPSAEKYFKFKNLVTLIPIENKHLNESHADIDLVKMNDEGEIEASVKFVAYQNADIPTRIDKDLFTVGLLTGQTAIVKSNGDIVHKLDKYYRIIDKYIVGSQAIYDFDLNKIYDLRANNGTVMGIIDNTVYINVKTYVGYDIISFRGGQTKTVFSFNADNLTGNVFQLMTDAHCYMIYNGSTGEFSYYNSEDEHITNWDKMLTLRHASETHLSYLMWNEGMDIEYCIFTNMP